MPKQRKKKGERGIYFRSDRRAWWYWYVDEAGRRMAHAASDGNKATAINEREDARARVRDILAGRIPATSKSKFGDLADKWLIYQKHQMTPASYERIRGIVEDHLKPHFAGALAGVTATRIHDYLATRYRDVTASTARKEFATLKTLLKFARRSGLMALDPTEEIRTKPPRDERLRVLSPQEVLKLLEVAPEWLRPIIQLAFSTGMRRSEILGLRWSYVDIAGRRILLPRTKNGSSRVVHLNDLALAALKDIPKDKQQPFAHLEGPWVSVAFSRTCTAAGISDMRFHDLRHVCASLMRLQGADVQTVAIQLGHKDLRSAIRYQHLTAEHVAAGVAGLDRAFAGIGKGQFATASLPGGRVSKPKRTAK